MPAADYSALKTGRQLRYLREELGLTREDVARMSMVSPRRVLEWESQGSKIPRRHRPWVAMALWSIACEKVLEESGLPECDWRPPLRGSRRDLKEIARHLETCSVCSARQAYAEKQVGPPPLAAGDRRAARISRVVNLVSTGAVIAVAVVLFALRTGGREPERPVPLPELEALVQERPDDADAQYALGAAYLERDRLSDALGPLRRAVELDRKNADARNDLGWALMQLRRVTEAVSVLREAVEIDPEHARAQHNLAFALAMLGRFDEAEAAYRAAVKLKPDDSVVHFELARVLMSQARSGEAAEHVRRAIELEPGNAVYHWALADAFKAVGKLDSAMAAYREATRREPQNPLLWGELGELAHLMGEHETAVDAFQHADSLDPTYFDERELQRRMWEYSRRDELYEPQ